MAAALPRLSSTDSGLPSEVTVSSVLCTGVPGLPLAYVIPTPNNSDVPSTHSRPAQVSHAILKDIQVKAFVSMSPFPRPLHFPRI